MFRMLLKKIIKNKWMVLSLTVGLILSISIVTAIPMYSRGILQKLIYNDLGEIQAREERYPGYHVFHKTLANTNEQDKDDVDMSPAGIMDWNTRRVEYKEYDNSKQENLLSSANDYEKKLPNIVSALKLPVISQSNIYGIYKLVFKEKQDGEIVNRSKFGKLNAISNVKDHVKIKNGKMFSNTVNQNGEYEVIISEQTSQTLNLFLNSTYYVYQPYQDYLNPSKYFKIKVVGIYTARDASDPFWFNWEGASQRSIIIDYDLFKKDFLDKNPSIVVNEVDWGYALDYKKINPDNINKILTQLDSQKKVAKDYGIELLSPMYYVLQNYQGKEGTIKNLLWTFEAPILLMMIIFTFMVSNLLIEQDKDEIGVLKSRGAKNSQILTVYLQEGLTISVIGVIFGPLLGSFLCKIIGAANGFLEFVQRKGLMIKIQFTDYLYCLPVILVFISTLLICAYNASKKSIVEHKQQKIRNETKQLWKKFYLDFILLGICGYGYYNYMMRNSIIKSLNISGNSMPVDPLLYIISTLFIISMGLLFLRLYPYIIKLIYKIGKKFWSPVVYSSLINVARSEGKNQFIMLFLILTISIGIFNVKAARSVNKHNEDKTRYMIGADMVIKTKWQCNTDGLSPAEKKNLEGYIRYKEPSFNVYKKIDGIQMATKVYIDADSKILIQKGGSNDISYINRTIDAGTFMGIIPYEFGKIAWFDPKLNSTHWYEYLNYLTQNPNMVFLSKSHYDNHNIRVGDKVYVKYNNEFVDFTVAGFIDYWPTLNPESAGSRDMIIANLNYLQHNRPISPYEVWIKKMPGYSDEKLYENIKKANLNINKIQDANQEVINMKNEPTLQGSNGALSMGFIATMIITAIGFLIYWIISIKNRTMQFGIFRAMGLSSGKVIGMLLCEQLLISVAAVGAGTLIGQLNSSIFVPMLQINMKKSEMVLPFKIIAVASDYIKLYSIIFIVLIIGFIILTRYIKRMKINQAIKLGED